MVSDCGVYYRHNMHVKIWWWCSWLSKLGPMLIARGLKVQFPRLAQSYRVAFKPGNYLSTVWLASIFNRNKLMWITKQLQQQWFPGLEIFPRKTSQYAKNHNAITVIWLLHCYAVNNPQTRDLENQAKFTTTKKKKKS